jgi:hypothetical protein
MLYREQRKSVFHFLTNVFAIIGGLFTVFRMADSLLYRWEQGKQQRKGPIIQ